MSVEEVCLSFQHFCLLFDLGCPFRFFLLQFSSSSIRSTSLKLDVQNCRHTCLAAAFYRTLSRFCKNSGNRRRSKRLLSTGAHVHLTFYRSAVRLDFVLSSSSSVVFFFFFSGSPPPSPQSSRLLGSPSSSCSRSPLPFFATGVVLLLHHLSFLLFFSRPSRVEREKGERQEDSFPRIRGWCLSVSLSVVVKEERPYSFCFLSKASSGVCTLQNRKQQAHPCHRFP